MSKIIRWLLLATALLGAGAHAETGYVLQPGDMLNISVWKENDLSGEVLVRPDGAITVPLAGQVAAAGHTTDEVRTDITERLQKYLPDPVVTVTVKQTTGNEIYVIGKVNKPGPYPVNRPVDVMQALSLAGGMTPFAAANDIRILRRQGDHQITLHFRYRDVERGRNLQQNILLQGGDTVVVP